MGQPLGYHGKVLSASMLALDSLYIGGDSHEVTHSTLEWGTIDQQGCLLLIVASLALSVSYIVIYCRYLEPFRVHSQVPASKCELCLTMNSCIARFTANTIPAHFFFCAWYLHVRVLCGQRVCNREPELPHFDAPGASGPFSRAHGPIRREDVLEASPQER